MKETRVNKYKSYRKSFLKEGSPEFSSPNEVVENIDQNATGRVPMDKIIEKKETSRFSDWIERNQYFLTRIAIAIGLCLVIVAIILGIIFLWR